MALMNRKKGNDIPVRSWIAGMVFLVFAQSFAGEDWQYWSVWQASYKLSASTTAKFLGEVYFKDDMSDDYLHDEYLGVEHALGCGFGAMFYMQHVAVENAAGIWNSSWNAVPGVNYSFDIPAVCKVKLQDRFYYTVDPVWEWDHHRPRIYLSRDLGPVKLTLSDEVRLDLSGERERDFYRNRMQAEISKKVTDFMTIGVAYVRQSDRKNGEWESFNVLQTVVGFSF